MPQPVDPRVLGATVAGGAVALHCCAGGLPWPLLQRSAFSAVSLDVSTLTADSLDGVGEFVESGRTVLLGVVPVAAPEHRPSAEEVARSVVDFTDRLGFNRAVLPGHIGVTPSCGMAGATPAWARTAVELTQKAADAIADDPAAILK